MFMISGLNKRLAALLHTKCRRATGMVEWSSANQHISKGNITSIRYLMEAEGGRHIVQADRTGRLRHLILKHINQFATQMLLTVRIEPVPGSECRIKEWKTLNVIPVKVAKQHRGCHLLTLLLQ